jgi:ribosomal protein L37AE/L43A
LNRKKKKRASVIPGMKSNRCPYCGSHTILRSADGIYKSNGAGTMLYVCSKYPACDAYVRVLPGTTIPVGSLANGNLRALRLEAHHYFDRIYQTGIMSRDEAYEWLSDVLQTPLSQSHIGLMGEYYCRQVINECKKLFDNRRKVQIG